MGVVVLIVVDSREVKTGFGERVLDGLKRYGLAVRVEKLGVGDYAVVDDKEVYSVIERKGIGDLIGSVLNNRLMNQLSDIRGLEVDEIWLVVIGWNRIDGVLRSMRSGDRIKRIKPLLVSWLMGVQRSGIHVEKLNNEREMVDFLRFLHKKILEDDVRKDRAGVKVKRLVDMTRGYGIEDKAIASLGVIVGSNRAVDILRRYGSLYEFLCGRKPGEADRLALVQRALHVDGIGDKLSNLIADVVFAEIKERRGGKK